MADEKIDKIAPEHPSEHYRLPLRMSEGFRNMGLASNKTYRWGRLCERMVETVRDNITIDQYNKLSQRDRHERKNQGWFVGGTFKDGRRKGANIESRSLLAYDLDECSVELYRELLKPRTNFLAGFEYFLHTTRSHTPESPRIRVVIPLAREVTSAEFSAVIRLVAYRIHADMDQIDPVSFRITQFMFWPTTSKDGEYKTKWNYGKLLDPDAVIADWNDDWKDLSRLPHSPRESKQAYDGAHKPQDPRTKRGVIGAWCRAHTISEIIDEWLPDVYALGDMQSDGTQRYTYLKGSTTNGMVVYENDTYAWSNHSTDPGADKLLNPFDFMRVHWFGHLDKDDAEYEEGGDVTKLKSYKAMVEFAQEDAGTIAELQKANYDLEAMANDSHWDIEEDDPIEPPPESKVEESREPAPAAAVDDKAWMKGLSVNKDGIIKSDLHNIIHILENDARFKGAFAYNMFINQTVVVRRIRSKHLRRDAGPVKDKANGDPLTDVVVTFARSIIEAPRGEGNHGWGIKVSEQNIWGAIYAAAYGNRFHPVQRYLEACKWDGVPRLKKMLHTYWHVEDNTYHEQVGFLTMIAAVARVYEPGHKFDFVPIFEGRQGLLKSTAISTISGADWFVEFHAKIGDTRAVVENIQGKWFVELPELVSLMDDKASVEALKALFSGKSDRTRQAYLRTAQDFPRQCIFSGTTNNREYLRDATGNRRYWIVELPDIPIDVPGLRRDRDLIWAEAREEYFWFRRQPQFKDKTVPLPLFLPPAESAVAEALQGIKTIVTRTDIRRGLIEAWLDTPVPMSRVRPGWRNDGEDLEDMTTDEPKLLRNRVCVADIVHFVLHGAKDDYSLSREVGGILSNLPGWKRYPGRGKCGSLGAQVVWDRLGQPQDDLDL